MDEPVSFRWRRLDDLEPRQLHDILRLRQDVFVVEQRCVFADIDGLDLQAWHLLGHTPRGELAALLRLLPPGLAHRLPAIGRVATHPLHRGRGLAARMMTLAIEHAADSYPAQALFLSAQSPLVGFYRRLGFEPVSAPYDEDGIEHVDMQRPPTAKPVDQNR